MTNYYIGYTDGNGVGARGYLVSNGEVFGARSGSSTLRKTPEGTYTIDSNESVDGTAEPSLIDNNNKKARHRKFRFVGNGPRNGGTEPGTSYTALDGTTKQRPIINDGNIDRTGLLLHFDGGTTNGNGTAGCIGYDSLGAQNALESATASGDTSLRVIYVKDQKTAKTLAKMYADPPQDFHDRHPKWATGELSDIKNGNKMAEGEPTVVHGAKQHQAVGKDHLHTGGAKVAEGNSTILLGKQQKQMAGIDHATTDNSAVATGENSIQMGGQ
ncbi:hypothetical protein [Polyangium aurulentum]|uniref:hypothetical protein n=1 Tax=Polyangium aurulentum TaxID=2567896 RepID=UPI0010AE525D|nr:hypothetical protein [Polyangium aurulentum]UQA56214.1 hypothetical protein E8A73_033585 [Polyangium aurulentum]